MEKEKKKVVKEVKVEAKEIKKNVKNDSKGNDIIITSEIKKATKVLAMIVCFLATLGCIFTFVFGIITSLKVANIEKTELLHDNFSVTFIANLNGEDITEIENIIEGYGSKALFIAFNVVIPAIALICILMLLIILSKKTLDFVNSVSHEKELFTKEKLYAIEMLMCITEAILTISFIIFKRPSIILYIFVSVLLFIIIGLFKKCIEYKNNH